MIYLKKFAARLNGKNRVYVTQTVRLIDSLIAYLQSKDARDASVDGICRPADLLAGKGVDQINLFKLNAYIQESRLARKVDGYNSQIQDEKTTEKSPSAPVLMQVQSFMLALMNPSTEGRFFYAKDDTGLYLKYMLLDPTKCFQEVVDEARAVILAGGTMSPMEDYRQHLFSYIPESRIQTLTCSHIVPPSSLVVYPVSKDRRGTDFTFTFEKRSQRDTIVASGQALLEFISVIPDGVVAFFPSYGYLATCMSIWQGTTSKGPQASTLWQAMQAVKPVFWEQKASNKEAANQTSANETESALSAYTAAVRQPARPHKGALLLAVISGSLSEGINFSDELGRGVLVFGLPYPNPRSAEWTARREHVARSVEEREVAVGRGRAEAARKGGEVAREFYENATMRAVAQAVGRAIRHRGDYAAVLLVDARYEGERIQGKLPRWMRGSVRSGCDMGSIQSGLREFFKAKAAAG
jgi:chromosome transmission fidelity protein 1